MKALHCQDVSKTFRVRERTSRLNGQNGCNGNNGQRNGIKNWLGLSRKDFHAVRNINFNVENGEIFGIIGENGSGKSTLIRMISTLLLPSFGNISVFGFDVQRDFLKVRTMINRVSVEAAFFKRLSARENLLFAGRLYGIDSKTIQKKMVTILERVNFPVSKIDESMEDLSRGMQQKIAITRSLLTSPVMLLLDEPTTGLDPRSKKEVQYCVEDIRNNHDTTVIITTHDMVEADKLCDRIAIIDKGQFIAMDTPENLKKQVTETNQDNVTLEDVFLKMTGRRFRDDTDQVDTT